MTNTADPVEAVARAIWQTQVVTDISARNDPPTEPVGNLFARELGLQQSNMQPLAESAIAAYLEATDVWGALEAAQLALEVYAGTDSHSLSALAKVDKALAARPKRDGGE